MPNILDIDGSVLEGGGQILRMAISFSAIMGVPIRVFNIRAGRSKPGLAAQHLKGIQLVGEMCKAKVTGAQIGSVEIEFVPGKLKGGHYMADTQTAGSISLLLQVALPCALLADGPVTLDLKGGTNADMAPQIDYMDIVFRHALNKFGADFNLKIFRRGYFPRGGGHVQVDITPVRKLSCITVTDSGIIDKIEGRSFVAGTLPIKLAHEMGDGARHQLKDVCSTINIHCYKEDRQMAPDSGSGIILWCSTSSGCVLGSDALGRRGARAHELGRRAADTLAGCTSLNSCLDAHTQDQVILYMALADGTSKVKCGEITLHTKTAIYIAEKIAKVKFEVEQEEDHCTIQCTGIGFTNRNVVD